MIERLRSDVIKKLAQDQHRLEHVLEVERVALEIARNYHIEYEKVSIAALYHDYCKNDSLQLQIAQIDQNDVIQYQDYPVMYHALAAASMLEKTYHIKDQDIINAIKYHVWGRTKMSLLEKIIFVSDLAEPTRKFFDGRKLIETAKTNIDLATYQSMEIIINYVKKENKKPSSEQIAAFAHMKEELCGKT